MIDVVQRSTPDARIAVLASGRGSNLQALIEAQSRGELGAAQLAVVISDVEHAPALERARRAGLTAEFCGPRGLTATAYDARLLACLERYDARLLCLAGYMRILSPSFVAAFPGPILNIHPSLLPAFPGLHAQRQAWEHGVKLTGATVHLVDAGLDTGPIILQQAVEVLEDDDSERLAARILQAEHNIYPRAVRLVVSGRLRYEGRRVRLAQGAGPLAAAQPVPGTSDR